MIASTWHKLDQAGRNLTPMGVTLMLVLLSMVPFRLPNAQHITPLLTLTAIYYWAIHRPDLLRPVAVFGIGLLQDLMSGAPLGMNALLQLLTYQVAVNQRRFFLGKPFMQIWWGFSMIMLGAMFVQWLAYSLLHLQVLPLNGAFFQALLTIALFPPFAWLFIRVQRAFLHA